MQRNAGDWWKSGPFLGEGREARIRADAGRILHAGLAAADPERGVVEALERRTADSSAFQRVTILAMGKAAAAMSRGAIAVLGERVRGGLAVVPGASREDVPQPVSVMAGEHPLPSNGSLAAGAALMEAAGRAGETDLVLCLISGGASALAVQPVGAVTVEDLAALTEALLEGGAPIEEINTVRKHLDALRGGRLARRLAPARVLGLLISDVPGDVPDVIASGPLVPDPTTWADVHSVLERRGIWTRASERVRAVVDAGMRGDLPDTPKPGGPGAHRVEVEIIVSAGSVLDAAAEEARTLGYSTDAEAGHIAGEARETGAALARALLAQDERRAAVLRVGETTVTVRGRGRGGRNQEVALGAGDALEGEVALLAALGTDGIDGPTDAAGAITTGSTIERARSVGLDAHSALADNDAYPFFDALGDLIRTGPTGTNVMDLYLGLADRRMP